MALGVSFGTIINNIREESGISTVNTSNVDHLTKIKRKLKRHYTSLLDEYDWKHLDLKIGEASVQMVAGQRYYDFPSNVNVNKITAAWFYWGNQWLQLEEGITPPDYNAKDSDLNERSDPGSRWAWRDESQFEVWPLPASAEGKVSFEGQRAAQEYVEDDDLCDLDDVMLQLYVSAELLIKVSKDESEALIAQANKRRDRMIVSNVHKDSSGFVVGQIDPRMSPRAGGITISHIRKAN